MKRKGRAAKPRQKRWTLAERVRHCEIAILQLRQQLDSEAGYQTSIIGFRAQEEDDCAS